MIKIGKIGYDFKSRKEITVVEENTYALIFETESPIQILNAEAADKAITTALQRAVKAIQKISKQYRNVGIGDTTTDDSISDEFHNLLHFGD